MKEVIYYYFYQMPKDVTLSFKDAYDAKVYLLFPEQPPSSMTLTVDKGTTGILNIGCGIVDPTSDLGSASIEQVDSSQIKHSFTKFTSGVQLLGGSDHESIRDLECNPTTTSTSSSSSGPSTTTTSAPSPSPGPSPPTPSPTPSPSTTTSSAPSPSPGPSQSSSSSSDNTETAIIAGSVSGVVLFGIIAALIWNRNRVSSGGSNQKFTKLYNSLAVQEETRV
jgi:hypothetical protein